MYLSLPLICVLRMLYVQREREVCADSFHLLVPFPPGPTEYTLKIKNIYENLASINAPMDDDDKIEVCLHGLGPQYKPFATSIRSRENLPSFADLVSKLIMEEKSMGESSLQSNKNSKQQVFYSNTVRGCGRGCGHG